MINRIKTFFSDSIVSNANNAGNLPAANSNDKVRRATAALLVEVMVTDGVLDDSERNKIRQLLQGRFELSANECEELFTLAEQEVAEATSLYQFTALVNNEFSADDKYGLIRNLWEVAYSDGVLDKHEEGLIRNVADLIHLPHSRFIQARNSVRDRS
ncbi:MAG: TerB family tellurite resistance protein [Porticoccaceae bacterium]